MKLYTKTSLILIVSALIGLISTVAMAAVVSNVANTKHNFAFGSAGAGFMIASNPAATQVCVFCHTPHNAGNNKLLWNKASNTNINFRLYTSSGTLTSVTKNASSLPAGSPSLLCLSCHDGKTAMNVLHTSSTGNDVSAVASGFPAGAKYVPISGFADLVTMPAPMPDLITGETGPNMDIGGGSAGTDGGDLTNDHPIGFSYTDAYNAKSPVGAGLHATGSANMSNIRLFGTKNRVECSTCHDPHVDTSSDSTFAPFLVKSNTKSALCLSCHDK